MLTRRGIANVTAGEFTFITPTLRGPHNFKAWERDVGAIFANIDKHYSLRPRQYSIPLTKRKSSSPGYGFNLAECKLITQGFAHFSGVIKIVFPCLGEKMFTAGDPAAADLPQRIERMGNIHGLLKVVDNTFQCLSIDHHFRGILFYPDIRPSSAPPIAYYRLATEFVENLIIFVEAILQCQNWQRLRNIAPNMAGFKLLMTGKHEPEGSAFGFTDELEPRSQRPTQRNPT